MASTAAPALSDQGGVWRYFAEAGGERWAEVSAVFGRLVAQGLLDHDEALAAMVDGCRPLKPEYAAAERQSRLAQALGDSAWRWDLTRDRARFAIRRALGPLLAERAPSARLLAAAAAVNAQAGDPLLPREVKAEVVREVYWAARRLQREGVAR